MAIQGIDQMLGELRAMSQAARGAEVPAAKSAEAADFAGMLKSSIDQVSQMQQSATAQQQAFETGAPEANLQDVMVSLQKASLSFQTMVQVRNRLVTAYQDMMNMQV
jgi:flagellar hook-basal body complex protein FliE